MTPLRIFAAWLGRRWAGTAVSVERRGPASPPLPAPRSEPFTPPALLAELVGHPASHNGSSIWVLSVDGKVRFILTDELVPAAARVIWEDEPAAVITLEPS